MQKTTAKVEHRDYVPWDYIAIRFCNVDFYGARAEEMREKWYSIWSNFYEDFKNKYDSLYKENKTKIQNLYDKANELREQVKESKPFYRPWYNKAELEMLDEAERLLHKAYKLEEKNKKVRKKSPDVFTEHTKIETFLRENGFVLTSTSSSGNRCVTKTEVWTLEE